VQPLTPKLTAGLDRTRNTGGVYQMRQLVAEIRPGHGQYPESTELAFAQAGSTVKPAGGVRSTRSVQSWERPAQQEVQGPGKRYPHLCGASWCWSSRIGVMREHFGHHVSSA